MNHIWPKQFYLLMLILFWRICIWAPRSLASQSRASKECWAKPRNRWWQSSGLLSPALALLGLTRRTSLSLCSGFCLKGGFHLEAISQSLLPNWINWWLARLWRQALQLSVSDSLMGSWQYWMRVIETQRLGETVPSGGGISLIVRYGTVYIDALGETD